MVKKVKKLSEEEIEEYKHENYQMMSAISGKPISELMGESTSRPNYKENYCLIKQMYLKNCAEPISSRQLYELLQKQGYKAKYSTFRGLTNYYMKNGYICKTNAKKPFLYILTTEGKLHAKSPYIKVDENIQRYREFQLNKLKEIINNDPATFKSIYESIHGAQPVINTVVAGTGGSQYSHNDIGSDLQDKLEAQIFTPDFFKNADEQKLKALVDGILDNSLSDEQKKELLLDVIDQARKNNTMIFKQQEYTPSKSIGLRNYYTTLINTINNFVTKSTYEAIPFRFIKVDNQIRLKSISESGIYKNNDDGTILDFDYVNRNWFQNQMKIKTETGNKELTFFYIGGNSRIKITTMSFNDYEKAKGKANGIKLKINT